MYWAIFADDGTVQQVEHQGHPCDATDTGAAPYGADRSRVVELARKGDLAIEDVQPDGTWMLNLERYRARCLSTIDTERGRRVAADPRTLFAHVRKGAEAAAILDLDSAELTAMSSGDRALRFPWLSAEAEQRGEQLGDTAARVRTALADSEARVSCNEARAITAKDLVRAAATREAIDAAAAIEWEDL